MVMVKPLVNLCETVTVGNLAKDLPAFFIFFEPTKLIPTPLISILYQKDGDQKTDRPRHAKACEKATSWKQSFEQIKQKHVFTHVFIDFFLHSTFSDLF